MVIETRADLIEYGLRKLGKPVIKINIDESQIDDCLDDALQYYREYHMDAIVNGFYSHEITQADIDNGYITLPESIIFLTRCLDFNSGANLDSLLSLDYQLYHNNVFGLRRGGGAQMVDYYLVQEQLSNIRQLISSQPHVAFSRVKNRVYINGRTFVLGEYYVFEVYHGIDPETHKGIYDSMILKRHFVALLKKQWGQNLSKYEGVQLVGGATFNGRQILDDAMTEIREIEETYEMKFSAPPDFFVG